MTKKIIIFVLALTCFIGCEKSNESIVAEFKPQVDDLRKTILNLEKQIDFSDSTLREFNGKLDPPIVYQDQEGTPYNTEIIMYPQIQSYQITSCEMDLLLSKNLPIVFAMTYPDYRGSTSGNLCDIYDKVELRSILENTLSIDYLVIASVFDYDSVRIVDDSLMFGGFAIVDGYLFDIAKEELISHFRIKGEKDQQIEYKHYEGEKVARGKAFAGSSIWENSRKNFLNHLRDY